MFELVTWDDDSITRAPLHMRITPLITSSSVISVFAFNYWRMAALIFVKFGMDVVPLHTAPNSYLLFPTIGTTKVTEAQIREVGR
jgi:hypothetical protein